jgi:hypothetical protein
MAPTDITQDDIHAAKDAMIQMLTNALIRSQAECAALRREEKETPDVRDD